MYLDLRNYKLFKSDNNKDGLKFTIVPNILEYVKKNNCNIFKIIVSSNSSLDNVKEKITHDFNVDVLSVKKHGKYKDLIINKEYEYLDIVPKSTNKKSALEFLSSYLKINSKDVLAIGDNLNDIDMLKNVGISVAVNNAYDEVKKIAKHITNAPVEKGAFAEAIFKFL